MYAYSRACSVKPRKLLYFAEHGCIIIMGVLTTRQIYSYRKRWKWVFQWEWESNENWTRTKENVRKIDDNGKQLRQEWEYCIPMGMNSR